MYINEGKLEAIKELVSETVGVDDEKITFLSKSDGVLINGKGMHVRYEIDLLL